MEVAQLVQNGMRCCDVAAKFAVSGTYICELIKENGITLSKYGIELDDMQKSLIVGSLLGDAGCHRVPSGKCRLCFRHGYKQKQYLYWKYNILRSIVGSEPKHVIIPQSYSIESYAFATLTNRYITELASKLYVGNCKHVTHEYLGMIDDFALAVWMMDDGYMGKICGSLSSHAFSHDENVIIAEWFAGRFNVKQPSLAFDKRCNKYYMRLPGYLNKLVHTTIRPHVPKCMEYKLRWLN